MIFDNDWKKLNLNSNMTKSKIYQLALLFSFISFTSCLFGQSRTITGQIIDGASKEGVFAATISYSIDGYSKGTTTDFDGNFSLNVPEGIDSIKISHISYKPIIKMAKTFKASGVKISLQPYASQIKEVVITAKKEKYTNKDNPAVIFIRNVIDNKKDNNIINHSPMHYKAHNKSLLALDKIDEKDLVRLRLKPVKNLMNNIEESYFGNKDYLPMYFYEELSELYAREGGLLEQQRLGIQDIKLSTLLDEEKANQIKGSVFSNINLYNDYINILGNQLMSPLNIAAPTFYKFFIKDTVVIDGRECIWLDFIPRNIYDLGFLGDLYISNDGKYELISAKLSLPEKSNINFVDKIVFTQNYKTDTLDIKGKSQKLTYIVDDGVYAKVNMYGVKMYGYSINTYSQPIFEEYTIKKSSELKNFTINETNRLSALNSIEKKTYLLPDSLNKITWFRVTKYLSEVFYGGYILSGPFYIGPIDNLVSFNNIEGTRLRFSGKTNYKLSRKIFADWMVAYGTKDEKFKYDLGIKYSFNSAAKTPYSYPANFIGIQYTNNTFVPGRTIGPSNYDRIALSLTEIIDYKLAWDKSYAFQWYYQTRKGLTLNPYIKFQKVDAYGNWNFGDMYGKEISGFEYNRVGLNLSISLNGQIIPNFRSKYKSGANYTSLNVNYEYGFENTHLLKLNAFRKLNFMPLGYMKIWAEGGYIWGQMLSPYLFVNSTSNNIVYSQTSFNLMRPMEFYSDKYAQLIAIYNLNGFIFNRIPFIRELKLREEFNIKMAYGGLRDDNKFMINGNTVQTFGKEPYIEAGFGFQNLFGVLGVDYTRRITYAKDLPEHRKWGIRLNLVFQF
ncbi:MAG: hypothetical protein H6Q15_213 [Bacteroidetes bacterium]|nr:hypothetical protein [Bacteroidota bacterium]